MDIRFVNPFVTAIQNVFKTMIATDTIIGKPFLKGTDDASDADVYAMIGLSGQVMGMIVIAFPQATALKIAKALTGEEMGIDHPDLGDALGELINMVTGQAKSLFTGVVANISLPNVVIGSQMQTLDTKQPTLVLPCDSTLGRFRVEVTIATAASSATQKDAG